MKQNIVYGILLITFFSCIKEQGVPGPTGAQGPAGTNGKGSSTDTASISGNILMFDEFGINQKDASGAVVTLSSGSQQHKDTTDAAGGYAFPGITSGTYDLTFQKTGYGTMKKFGLSHFGGGTQSTYAGYANIIQVPVKTAPTTLTVTANNSLSIGFRLVLDTSSLQFQEYGQNFLLLLSKNKTVSVANYDYNVINNGTSAYTSFNPDGAGGYTLNFSKSNIPGLTTSFNPGDTLYAVAYTYAFWGGNPNYPLQDGYGGYGFQAYYLDPLTGKIVYPSLSTPTNIVKFTF